MKPIKLFNLAVICSFILLNTVGCVQTNSENITPTVSIIMLGNHANSKVFDVKLDSVIKKAYEAFGNMGIVVVDGTPDLLRDTNMNILGFYEADYLKKSQEEYINNPTRWSRSKLAQQTKVIKDALDTCIADSPEVDTLGALYVASESLSTMESSMGKATEKEITILDTGLSTTGALNFLAPEFNELLYYEGPLWEDKIMSSKVSELITQLDKEAELPNLKGVRVTWYGLGQVCAPQPALSKLNILNLQYIWGELLLHAGASPSATENADEKYGIFISTSASGIIDSDQYVTSVILNKTEVPEPPKDVKIAENKIGFCANSTEYLTPEDVIDILKIYKPILDDSPDKMLLLVGTTSSWNGGSLELSMKRAEKVKNSMIDLGISEDCIYTIGLGYDLNICQNDSPNGQFEEPIAIGNRSVLILPYDSPKAKKLLSNNE